MVRRKNGSLLTLVIVCSSVGVVLGGTASWADSNTCLQNANPSPQCLTKSPAIRTVEGMSAGLVAGLGASLGAAWQGRRRDG